VSGGLLIIGAGPAGLGAAHRLTELGRRDWVLLETSGRVGGLARSETDGHGFTYDIGGHVLFSHYRYYSELVDALLAGEYTWIRRNAAIWMRRRYLPYPFQHNFGALEPRIVYDCLSGLVAARLKPPATPPASFDGWVRATFGDGIARHFLLPYNGKVWATPAAAMSHGWTGDRVPEVDLDTVLRNVLLGAEDTGWGPNTAFRYPLRGGTGHLSTRLAEGLPGQLKLRTPVTEVDPLRRQVRTAGGHSFGYEALLSTMPLDDLIERCTDVPARVRAAAARLRHCGSHVVGVAVDRTIESPHTWVYFPEPAVRFHRVTFLSHYSPHLVARPGQTLLLAEISVPPNRLGDPAAVVASVLDGLAGTGVLDGGDRSRIAATWHRAEPKTYPVPTLDRDEILSVVQPWLERHGIYSRGRFGAWRYEIGNMDHCCMQGVEWADHILHGSPERVWAS
jgi:protoporphyrinogen oxidase